MEGTEKLNIDYYDDNQRWYIKMVISDIVRGFWELEILLDLFCRCKFAIIDSTETSMHEGGVRSGYFYIFDVWNILANV